jgi:hypothetical protein
MTPDWNFEPIGRQPEPFGWDIRPVEPWPSKECKTLECGRCVYDPRGTMDPERRIAAMTSHRPNGSGYSCRRCGNLREAPKRRRPSEEIVKSRLAVLEQKRSRAALRLMRIDQQIASLRKGGGGLSSL